LLPPWPAVRKLRLLLEGRDGEEHGCERDRCGELSHVHLGSQVTVSRCEHAAFTEVPNLEGKWSVIADGVS